MPAFVSRSNSNSWPLPKSFRVFCTPCIGWTCQIESLEGRDQLPVLRLWSQGMPQPSWIWLSSAKVVKDGTDEMKPRASNVVVESRLKWLCSNVIYLSPCSNGGRKKVLVDECVLHLQNWYFWMRKWRMPWSGQVNEECEDMPVALWSGAPCQQVTSLSKQAKCKQASPLGSSPYALTVTIIWICNVWIYCPSVQDPKVWS